MQQPPFTALAQVYDAIMSDVEYDAWADFVLTYARDRQFPLSSALDLACGTGGLSRELRRAGLRVTGIDGSPDMLRVAQQRLNTPAETPVTLLQGDLRSWETAERFDLITCVFDSLNNLTKPQDLLRALRQMRLHLSPTGLAAFDLNTRLGVRELWDGDALEGLAPLPDGREVHYHWLHSYDEARELGVVQAFCRALSGSEQEEFVEMHYERGYDPSDLAPLLREAGFTGWEMVEYPDYADPQPDTPRLWVFAWLRGEASA